MSKNHSFIIKKLNLYRKPGFACHWYPLGDKICLAMYLGTQSIYIDLTKQQWKNFKLFLQKTITQKNFSKDHQGFSGFDIKKNKIQYYSNRIEASVVEKIIKDPRLAKERIRLRRELADVLKNRLTKNLDIIGNQITISLTRNAFYSFRKAILHDKSI